MRQIFVVVIAIVRTMQQQTHFHAQTPKETTLYMTTPELLAIRWGMC